jgi:hypothetical protein
MEPICGAMPTADHGLERVWLLRVRPKRPGKIDGTHTRHSIELSFVLKSSFVTFKFVFYRTRKREIHPEVARHAKKVGAGGAQSHDSFRTSKRFF